jgi:hypothetical protein
MRSNFVGAMRKVVNRGVGAGGASATIKGLTFEERTNNVPNLIRNGYEVRKIDESAKGKFNYTYTKRTRSVQRAFVKQTGFSKLMKKLDANLQLHRRPDEAYLIYNKQTDTLYVKVLEKKSQTAPGSVDLKLWAGPTLKEEYRRVFLNLRPKNIVVDYAFCLSEYLKQEHMNNPKYKHLNDIFKENGIMVFYGEDPDYFDKLNKWVNSYGVC